MKIRWKTISLFAFSLIGGMMLTAAEMPCQPPPPPNAPHGEFRRSGGKEFESFLNQLPESERAKLKAMRKSDPRAFREAVMNIIEKKIQEDFDRLLSLRNKYLTATDPKVKEEAKAELRKELKTQQDRNLKAADFRIKKMEEQLKLMEKRLDGFKKENEKRKANADASLDKMVDGFLDPEKVPELPRRPDKRNDRRPEPPHDGAPMPPPPPPQD